MREDIFLFYMILKPHILYKMDLSFFPLRYQIALDNIDINLLYQIRMRKDYPIKINYDNKNMYLGQAGLSLDKGKSLIASKEDIDFIIDSVTEHSIYAFNDRIKNGYISTKSAIRIGLAGECVFHDGKIQTIKDFSSLNIRIPHEISNCSSKIIKHISSQKKVNSSLIISPPFLGKTTLLKDIALQLNKHDVGAILIIDERGEFNNINGENIDKITYSNKEYAFNFAIRSLSPSIIMTDELSGENDWKCAFNALNSGIKIIASCHSDNMDNLLNKKFFIDRIFERYIILKQGAKFGEIDSIFDKEHLPL